MPEKRLLLALSVRLRARQSVHVRRSRFISALIVVLGEGEMENVRSISRSGTLGNSVKATTKRFFFSAERGRPHAATVPRLPPRHGRLHVHRQERHPARRQQDHQTGHRL